MKCTILAQDIPQKLEGCIFRYKGHPYYTSHAGGTKLALYELGKIMGGAAVHQIHFQDEFFDISSVPLGYLNYENADETVYYITRSPIRKVKQGVCPENVHIYRLNGNKVNNGSKVAILQSKFMADSILGNFPSLENSLKELRLKLKQDGITKQKAVSRSIALAIDAMGLIKVYHKNIYVGWIAPDDYTVHVKSNDLGWVVSKYLGRILGWKID